MKICLANSVWLVYFFPYTSPEMLPPSDVEAVQDGPTIVSELPGGHPVRPLATGYPILGEEV